MTDQEPVGETETARMVPGTDLVLHAFPSKIGEPMFGQSWIDGSGGEIVDEFTHDMAKQQVFVREIAAALSTWQADEKLSPSGRQGAYNVFDRNKFVAPEDIYDQMRMARRAVDEDDVIGGAADTTESLAISGTHFESDELDEANVFNQWADKVGFHDHMKVCWREVFTDAQSVVAMWWGQMTLQVDGKTPPTITPQADGTEKVELGNKRRKTYSNIYCPIALTTLDSTKVVPVGNFAFGQELLCWQASQSEMDAFKRQQNGDVTDAMMSRLFVSQYTPSPDEVRRLRNMKVNPEALLLMNPEMVFRYTRTRPSYKPWADVRLKRTFRFLDIKQQLMYADRTALIGNANYILLIKKGDKDRPASTVDLEKLNASFQYIAKLPVMIGDDTLTVEIISPRQEFTLLQERYGVVQMQILHSVYQTFRAEGAGASRSDNMYTVARAIAKGLQAERESIGNAHVINVIQRIVNHPLNTDKFKTDPAIAFTPRNVALDMDQAQWQALTAAHASGDVSRRSFLEELGLDIDVEAARRLEEDEYYDAIFRTATPFNSPGNNPFGQTGGPGNNGGAALPPGQGGGGKPPGTPAKKAVAKVAAPGKRATKKTAARTAAPAKKAVAK